MKNALSLAAPDWVVFEPNLPGCHWHRAMTELASCMGRGRWVAVTAFPSKALEEWVAGREIGAVYSKPVAAAVVHRVLVGEADPPGRRLWTAPVMSLARAEWEHLNNALAECDGNVSVAARRLAIPRQTLYRKLRSHPPPG